MIEDYSRYRYTAKEYLIYILQGAVITVILGGLFYQSIPGMLLLSPFILPYLKVKKASLIKKRKWKLNLEFKNGIVSLSAALKAGYSAEHAFEEALKDLSLLYDEKSMIMQEFSYLVNQIRMNITVEKALNDFGERSGVDDIVSFAEVFTTAKRTGGDLINVIRVTSNSISDKIDVKREIITLVTEKKYEADIMKLIPPGIICYLSLTSPGFLDPLYHSVFGIFVMTILLGVYLGTFLLIDKLVDIKV